MTLGELKREYWDERNGIQYNDEGGPAEDYIRALEAIMGRVREFADNPCLAPDATSAELEEILKGE